MTYNVNGQMTGRAFNWSQYNCWTGTGQNAGISYVYSATQNNGQITQAVDTMSGETISYTYDSLKRLTYASSAPISGSSPAAWNQAFTYDGFGNLTGKSLNGGSNLLPGVNATNNQLSGSSYDLNGNMLTGVGAT